MQSTSAGILHNIVEVDAKYISRIESGISSPSFEMITKFALALEVQPELLFRFQESEKKEDLIKGINQKLEKTDLASLKMISKLIEDVII